METAQLLVRATLLGLALVVVQLAAVSQIAPFGVNPDLIPLFVVSVGLLGGAVAGTAAGFAAGLLVDLALLQTLGVSSLVLIVVGYYAGRVRETSRDPGATLLPLAVGAAGTAVAVVGFSLMQFLLGVDAPVSIALLRQIVLTILLNSLLALPVYALVRRVLGPALPETGRRRRRAYRTPLSPLTRA